MTRLLIAVALSLLLAPPASAWTWPAEGEVLRPFALQSDPYAAGQHRGVDIAAGLGQPVVAPAAGSVSFAGTVPHGGKTLTIRTAGGLSVTLQHLAELVVTRGAVVAEGDLVARAGSSGDPEHDQPYVHLGIRRTAEKHGYLDPMALLPPRAAAGSPAGPAVDPEPEPAPAPAAEPVSTPAVPAAAPVAAGPAAEAVPVASAHVEPAPAAVAAPLARVATRPRVASPSTGSPGSRGTPTEVAAPGHAQAQTTERPTGNRLRRVRLESRRRTRVENGRPRPRAKQPTAPAGRRLRRAQPVVTTTLAAREAPAAFVRRRNVLTLREPSSQGVSSEPPSATPWGLVLAAVAAVLAGACGLGRARRTPAPAE